MLREIRLLVQQDDLIWKVCKLAFSNTDASIYIFPYARAGYYYYGSQSIPEMQIQHTFNFVEHGVSSDSIPKLSIHESGQVHVIMANGKAGPLSIPPLTSLRGQHIATVSIDSFQELPEFNGQLRQAGATRDLLIPAEAEAQSGRLAFYLNGQERSFDAPECGIVVTLRRPTLLRPLHLGIAPKAQEVLGAENQQGVTVISGWDPNRTNSQDMDYLYVRGR